MKAFLKLFFFIFIDISILWSSPEEEKEFEIAKTYVDSQDYNRAIQTYSNLLNKQDPWKLSILKYNIGTVLLIQGEYQNSINKFNEINLGENPPNYYLKNLFNNLSIAKWKLSESLYQKQNKSIFEYGQILSLLYESLEDIQKIETLSIPLNASTIAFETYLKTKVILLKENFRSHFDPYTLQEGIAKVHTHYSNLSNQLNSLQKTPENPLLTSYLDKIVFENSSWNSFWEKLIKKNEGLDLFYKNYKATISNLAQSNMESTEKSLEDLNKELLSLLKKNFFNTPPETIIDNLFIQVQILTQYALLSKQKLESFLTQVVLVQDVFKEKGLNYIPLENTKKLVENAIKSYKVDKENQARVYLILSSRQINSLLQEWSSISLPDTHQLLNILIAEELSNILLTKIASKENDDLINTVLSESLNQTLSFAEKFWDLAKESQTYQFNVNKVCVYNPWNDVIPVFEKGFNKLLVAEKLLSSKKPPIKTLSFQNEALNFWQKTATLLQAQNSTSSSCRQNNNQQTSYIDDILRLLQQMEQDDHQKPSQEVKTGGKNESLW